MATNKVRLKVNCWGKLPGQQINGKDVVQLRFGPVYSGSEENTAFFAATPAATIEFFSANAQAADMFESGKSYYVDFTPAE